MPGNGTKLKNRNTIKAPKVSQRRFLRSVACENFAKLILDAIWSALDAISALNLDQLLRRAACPSPLAAEAVPVELFNIRSFFEHVRSEEHTSELQSLMRISYAVFCLKKKIDYSKQHNKA